MSESPPRALHVEEEPRLVFLIMRALAKGFASAQQALAAFGRELRAFTLVVTDLTMPGGRSGLWAQAVLAIRPDTNVVIASGCLDPAQARRAAAMGVRSVIHKHGKAAERAPLVSGLRRD